MSTAQPDRSKIDEFIRVLSGEDELGAVVRAHIHIEALLFKLLGLLVKDEDYLRKLNLEFSQCVDLAVALGLGREHAKGLRAFGGLRNEFAHNLDSELSEGRVNNLYESLSATDKEVVQVAYVQTNSQLGVSPPKFKDLTPKERFVLIAVALRGMLEVALLEVQKNQSISFLVEIAKQPPACDALNGRVPACISPSCRITVSAFALG
ncbi:MAG: hypothetical protein CAF45_011430 [Nitrospira sp. CG24E]|nr:MAG: hypothetical protein CAF45_011430 [Nitrospira sp. CG24E]